ncbi:hypothetical protein SAMN04489867_2621 [Pedococcus dokdonensis]|uniref:Gram-positive cocci surface proteins LPxTG domain-containing protein n=1 Tax=Pedococcus dokdonensis TaxID=443156 RepID=A0A1H0T3K3_9MICO|nr:hypothetical protein [Pedococcus dokdonensis]SDP48395.1 hypothetical protein SAMN04489867_2621 [Pedococcus dokdonensis]
MNQTKSSTNTTSSSRTGRTSRTSRTIAVAAVVGASFFVVPGTAQAAGCGTPAQPATYQTVTTPAVDATYLTEAQWTRVVTDLAAYTDYLWVRFLAEYAYTDYGWMRHVVDVPGVAASPEVSHTRHEWMRDVAHTETLWGYLVVDRPAGSETVHHDAVTHDEWVWERTVIDTPHRDAVAEEGHDEARYSRQVLVTPAGTKQQLVKEAYDESVVDVFAHTVHHDAVTHQETHPVYQSVTEKEWRNGWTYRWAVSRPSIFWSWTGNTRVVQELWGYQTVTVVDVPAYDEDVPTTWKTVHHDAVYETVTVPAVYDTEYQWAQADPGGDWSPTGETRHVVTREAEPEVAEVSHVEKSDYSAEAPSGSGWSKTGDTRTVVDEAAHDEQVPVEEVSHWEEQWSETEPTSLHEWVDRGQTRELPATTEFAYVDGEDTPEGAGWSKSGQTWTIVDQEAVTEVVEQAHDEFGFTTSATDSPWVESDNSGWLTGQSFLHAQDSYVPLEAPYRATGVVRPLNFETDIAILPGGTEPQGEGWFMTWPSLDHPAVTHTEDTWLPEGTPPDGDDWLTTGQTRQGDELTPAVPESTVQQLVTPAVPAGAPCAPADPGTGDGGAGDGGAGDGGHGKAPTKAPAAGPAASALPALAHTGADGTSELLALGGALVLAGAGITRVVRRRG